MEGAVAPPARQVTQWRWLALTIVLGFAGSLVAVAAFGKGTYAIGPLVVRMEVRPAASGTTELAVEPISGLKTGHASTTTHSGFLAFRGTVVNVNGTALVPAALAIVKDPQTFDQYLKDQAKDAGERFGIKVGLMALAGGAGGGTIVGLIGLRPRRLFQGAIAGLLLVGVLGLVAYQTYDTGKFKGTQFKSDSASARSILPAG